MNDLELLHEVALIHSVGYSLVVLFDDERSTYSTRRIGQVSIDKIDERDHESFAAALAHCSNEAIAELEANTIDTSAAHTIERLQLVTSLVSRTSTIGGAK